MPQLFLHLVGKTQHPRLCWDGHPFTLLLESNSADANGDNELGVLPGQTPGSGSLAGSIWAVVPATSAIGPSCRPSFLALRLGPSLSPLKYQMASADGAAATSIREYDAGHRETPKTGIPAGRPPFFLPFFFPGRTILFVPRSSLFAPPGAPSSAGLRPSSGTRPRHSGGRRIRLHLTRFWPAETRPLTRHLLAALRRRQKA